MSLGAGHVWQTRGVESSTCVDWIECVGCGAVRTAMTLSKTDRRFARVNPTLRSLRASESLFTGRPLGTCPAGSYTAQRRAKGEAEIRATLDRFE